jgi:uncharacterized protein (DUF2062 family)
MAQRRKTWFERKMPSREDLAGNRWLAPIAHRFLSPELWRFTRRSVPRGVALGLFAGFIIPLGQIFLAAFMALPTRSNVPVAVLVTFVTNPFTFPFWVVIANRVGKFVLNIDAAMGGMASDELSSGRWTWLIELFQAAGFTVMGFIVLAIGTSSIGYFTAGLIWRFLVARRRMRRLQDMEQRLDARLGAGGS